MWSYVCPRFDSRHRKFQNFLFRPYRQRHAAQRNCCTPNMLARYVTILDCIIIYHQVRTQLTSYHHTGKDMLPSETAVP
uniref:Uncharacterized protein n=1 Tax=Pararge aegeria TaxID=116150 RepID=S4PUH9_9NEOP